MLCVVSQCGGVDTTVKRVTMTVVLCVVAHDLKLNPGGSLRE